MALRSILDDADRRFNRQGAMGRAERTAAAGRLLEPVLGYPQQATAMRSILERPGVIAYQANRRAGKTSTMAALIAAALVEPEMDGCVIRVLTPQLISPTEACLDGPTVSVLRMLRDVGIDEKHMLVSRTLRAIREITMTWGTTLVVHNVATVQAIEKIRGLTANIWWVDEAQRVLLLPHVLTTVVYPTMADAADAKCILSGTPGQEIGTMFHNLCVGSTGDRVTRISCYSWDNPHFGLTFRQRWARILEGVVLPNRATYHLGDDDIVRLRRLSRADLHEIASGTADGDLAAWSATIDPRLQRELFGVWSADVDEYVFPWHDKPEGAYWARDTLSRFPRQIGPATPDVGPSIQERVEALRAAHPDAGTWSAAIGLDLGWSSSKTAFVVIAWAARRRQYYELVSRVATGMFGESIYSELSNLVRDLRQANVHVIGARGDIGGAASNLGQEWTFKMQQMLGFRLDAADKRNKRDQILALGYDVSTATLRPVEGGPLDIEARHLRYKMDDETGELEIDKFRQVTYPDGKLDRPGDHALDALRYVRPLCPHVISVSDMENGVPIQVEARPRVPTMKQVKERRRAQAMVPGRPHGTR